jgi:hypothetical protein
MSSTLMRANAATQAKERKPEQTVAGRDRPLFVASAVERMAIFAGVAEVPDARIRSMALARFDRHQPFAAVGKPLELDGGERIRCEQAAEQRSKNDKSRLHIHTPIFPRANAPSWNERHYAKARPIASLGLRAFEAQPRKSSGQRPAQDRRSAISKRAKTDPASSDVDASSEPRKDRRARQPSCTLPRSCSWPRREAACPPR